MEVELSEEDFLHAMDANMLVYLLSLEQMTHPLRQTRIEKDNLALQWNRIRRGKQVLQVLWGSNDEFYFLERHQILEHGLDEGFVARFDLATFAHEIFTPALDLDRCKRGLAGFTTIFLSEETSLSDDSQRPLRVIFSQLVAIILALHVTRQMATSSKRVTTRSIQDLCNTNTIPQLSRLSGMAVAPIVEVATRVSNDDEQLLSLYGNTLKLIKNQIKSTLQSHAPVTCQEYVQDCMQHRESEMSELYRDKQDSDNDKYQNEVWFPSQSQQDEGEKQSSYPSPEVSVTDEAPDEILGEASDEIPDEALDEAPEDDQLMKSQDERLDDQMEINHSQNSMQYTPTTKMSYPSQDPPRKLTRTRETGVSSKNALQRTTDSKSNSSSNAESDFVPPKLEKRSSQVFDDEDAYLTDPDNATDPLRSQGAGEGPSTDRDTSATHPAVRQPVVKKPRRMNRPWTYEEESRLRSLVPLFLYQEDHFSIKPRTVKWSKLKSHDEKNGNVLRHRTQVMLKDKYRELTDNGRHRALVSERNRSRNANANADNPL
ncbi:hypothetical protein EDD21DRAFT_368274 [Dissophora ornata]|nr:hypothetical protein EDD21DRAFT_368274 [Dissophora ornata]